MVDCYIGGLHPKGDPYDQDPKNRGKDSKVPKLKLEILTKSKKEIDEKYLTSVNIKSHHPSGKKFKKKPDDKPGIIGRIVAKLTRLLY